MLRCCVAALDGEGESELGEATNSCERREGADELEVAAELLLVVLLAFAALRDANFFDFDADMEAEEQEDATEDAVDEVVDEAADENELLAELIADLVFGVSIC